jgi:hypothetical protein
VGTAIVIKGQPRGTLNTFPKGSALDDFLEALGPDASIDRVQIWTALDATNTNASREPGTLRGAGSIVSVFHRQVMERERQRPTRIVHRPRREGFLRSWHSGFTRRHRTD